MDVYQILEQAVKRQVSDILITAGLPLTYKIKGQMQREGEARLSPEDTQNLIAQIYELAQNRSMNTVLLNGDDDFSFSLPALSRFRVNTLKQRSSLAAVIRVVPFGLPNYQELFIPEAVMRFADYKKGLLLVTGPAGCGKSTTLACLIDKINNNRSGHIITIEDPIEYLHQHRSSVVTQRELSIDTQSYTTALRAALRQAPNVILLGEMRDAETIRVAITAAETGHLVISTLHTIGAAHTIDRIIDSFPPAQQQQVRLQLAMSLQGVVSQQLIPAVGGGVIPAFEVMVVNNAIRNLIRESKAHQIETVIYSSAGEGMITMDTSLYNLAKEGKISQENAVLYSLQSEQMQKKLALG